MEFTQSDIQPLADFDMESAEMQINLQPIQGFVLPYASNASQDSLEKVEFDLNIALNQFENIELNDCPEIADNNGNENNEEIEMNLPANADEFDGQAQNDEEAKLLIIKFSDDNENENLVDPSVDHVIKLSPNKPVDFSSYIDDGVIEESNLAQALTRLLDTDSALMRTGDIDYLEWLENQNVKPHQNYYTSDSDDDVVVTMNSPFKMNPDAEPFTPADSQSFIGNGMEISHEYLLENNGATHESFHSNPQGIHHVTLNPNAPEFIPGYVPGTWSSVVPYYPAPQ